MDEMIPCPICGKAINKEAIICRYCKGNLIHCPFCKEITDSNAEKCKWCEAALDVPVPDFRIASNSRKRTIDSGGIKILTLEQNLIYKEQQKRFGVALLLNFILAGLGCVYSREPWGLVICLLAIFAYIISYANVIAGSSILVVLFIWSNVWSYGAIDLYNQKLKVSISEQV